MKLRTDTRPGMVRGARHVGYASFETGNDN